MTSTNDYDGPELWGADKSGGRIVLRERRYKGSAAFLDLRFHANAGETATHKGVVVQTDCAQGLGEALLAYSEAHNVAAQ
jgi:hypothetical protein